MKKNSRWLYIYANVSNWQLFFERDKFTIHLVGVPNEELWRDKLLFTLAKELWFNDFKEQFCAIMKQAALLDTPILTLYEKKELI